MTGAAGTGMRRSDMVEAMPEDEDARKTLARVSRRVMVARLGFVKEDGRCR
jgi:hypothetical protein